MDIKTRPVVRIAADHVGKIQQRAAKTKQTFADVVNQLIANMDEPVYSQELNERRTTKLAHAASILRIEESELISILIDNIDIRFIIGVKPEATNANNELRDLFAKFKDL